MNTKSCRLHLLWKLCDASFILFWKIVVIDPSCCCWFFEDRGVSTNLFCVLDANTSFLCCAFLFASQEYFTLSL